MKIEFFLKQGPTKSISNYGEIGIDEVIGAIENNDVVALDGKNNAVIIPKHNISHVVIHKRGDKMNIEEAIKYFEDKKKGYIVTPSQINVSTVEVINILKQIKLDKPKPEIP